MPAVRLPGQYYKSFDRTIINKSLVSASLPYLNEAAREYNDSQIEMVQNVFTERWVYTNQECNQCSGTGYVAGPIVINDGIEQQSQPVECSKCKGKGRPLRSGFEYVEITPPAPGQTAPPTPPMGSVVKNHEVIKIMEARINQHKYKALAAVNMQFTAQAPLSISGDAKMADRAESESFVSANAENMVSFMDTIYWFINEFRNTIYVPDKEARKAMLPVIQVPQNYDLLTANYLANELQVAKTATLSPTIINQLEIEYAAKKFQSNTEVAERLELIMTLNPFAGISVADVALMEQSGFADRIDCIVSSNISPFIDRAIFEYEKAGGIDFEDEAYDKQMELLRKYAKEIDDKNSAKEIVMAQIQNPAPAGFSGN